MKRFILSMIVVLVSILTWNTAAAKGSNKAVAVPQNVIVKQTTHFDDGRTLVLYYKKQGAQCEVYSPDNIDGYSEGDLTHVKSSNVEVVNKTEGKLIRRASFAEVRRLIKQLVNRFL